MKPRLFLAMVAILLIAADKPQDPKQTREKLQGTWQISEQHAGDNDITEDAKKFKFIIDGDKFILKQENDTVIEGTFTIIPDKSPMQVDWKVTKDQGDAEHNGKTSLSICQLDGDNLKICAAEPGETKRPTDFSVKGTNFMLVVMERAKK